VYPYIVTTIQGYTNLQTNYAIIKPIKVFKIYKPTTLIFIKLPNNFINKSPKLSEKKAYSINGLERKTTLSVTKPLGSEKLASTNGIGARAYLSDGYTGGSYLWIFY